MLVPYINFEYNFGLLIPKSSTTFIAVTAPTSWILTASITSNFGLMGKYRSGREALLFYEFHYSGPTLRDNPLQAFSESFLDNALVLSYKTGKWKFKFDVMQEFYRAGRNEIWGKGLFDFYRAGAGFNREARLPLLGKGMLSCSLHIMLFPNYTGLMETYISATSSEAAGGIGGKQNNLTLSAGYKNNLKLIFKGTLEQKLNISYFYSQTVIEQKSDGSVDYGNTPQFNLSYKCDFKFDKKLTAKWVLTNETYFKIGYSNQNYFHFTDITDPTTVTFLPGFFNYVQLSLNNQFTHPLTENSYLALLANGNVYFYFMRPILITDENNVVRYDVSSKARQFIFNLLTGAMYIRRVSDIYNWKAFAGFQIGVTTDKVDLSNRGLLLLLSFNYSY